MRKTVTAAAMAASLTIGGAAGAVLFVPSLSAAQPGDTPTDQVADQGHDAARGDGFLAEALAPLVDDGTIDQDQADAVVEAIRDARPAGRFFDHHFPFGSALLDVLGVDAAELRDAIAGGETIAEVAEANGVPVEDVIAALTAEAEERLEEAVADGRLTREEADRKLATATEGMTAMVNGDAPLGGGHHHGRRGPFGSGR